MYTVKDSHQRLKEDMAKFIVGGRAERPQPPTRPEEFFRPPHLKP